MMRKVLLISNYVFHYRIDIYNYFYEEFQKLGYEFHVLSNEFQGIGCNPQFIKHTKAFSRLGYIQEIKRINPDIVINFLHLKDKLIFALTSYCRFVHIPMIYWNHGINISKRHNRFITAIYKIVHQISDAIILYTPNELKYIAERHHKKVFVAYNTLCFSHVSKDTVESKPALRERYGIRENKIILFISRIQPYKKLDVLLDNFLTEQDVGLVIVGSGINEQQLALVNSVPHYYYLGPRYGDEANDIFNMGDVYSTPGHIGLGIVQAFFWGKPVVVLGGHHAPEIYYMKNGKNGYIVKNEQELKEKILYLLKNETAYNVMSHNAVATIADEANIDRMFQGFRDAIDHCLNK